jgi:Flp pilus assembly protein TadD
MRKTFFALAILVVAGLLAYSNSFSVPFQFDGLKQVTDNPMIRSLDNFTPVLEGQYLHPPAGSEYNSRRVVGYLTLALNYRFGGFDVAGYHIVNLAIHLINGILVYFLVMLTFRTPYFKSNGQEATKAGKTASWQAGKRNNPPLSPLTSRGDEEKGSAPLTSGGDAEKRFSPFSLKRVAESRLSPLRLRGDEGGLRFPDSRFTTHGSHSLIAFFAALLFVVHPVQTQAVTYIVQRFTSLAAMFYLLSVVFYINGRLGAMGDGQKSLSACQPASLPAGHQDSTDSTFTIQLPIAYRLLPIVYYFLSLLSAVLAMLTKEIAFTLPLTIVLYEFIFFKATVKKKLLFLLPVLLTLVVIPISVLGTHRPLGELLSDLSTRTRVQTSIPRWDYLMTQMRVITTYIRLLFLPVNQNLDYDYPVYHSLSQPPVILSSLFLLSLIGAAVYLLYKSRGHSAKGIAQRAESDNPPLSPLASRGDAEKRFPPLSLKGGAESRLSPLSLRGDEGGLQSGGTMPHAGLYRLIAFGVFWFFIALSVESSVIPIADVIFEHRLYLPSVGAFVAVSTAVFLMVEKIGSKWRAGKLVVPALSIIAIVLLAGATYARNEVWQEPVRLWQDVVRKSPGNARAYNDLGYLYLMRGETDRSMGYFQKALSILPGYSNAHTNLGVAYYEKGWLDPAIKQFKTALALEPYGPDVGRDHHNLGIAFTRKGLVDDAIREFQAALKRSPGDAEIYNDLGVAYRQGGLTDKAIQSFRKALVLDPAYVFAHLNLAEAYESTGRFNEARRHYNIARRLRERGR